MTRISKVTLKEPVEALVRRQVVIENGEQVWAVFCRLRDNQTWRRIR